MQNDPGDQIAPPSLESLHEREGISGKPKRRCECVKVRRNGMCVGVLGGLHQYLIMTR
jgi:hypothetical protein